LKRTILNYLVKTLELKRLESQVRGHRRRFEDETRTLLDQASYRQIHVGRAIRRLTEIDHSPSGVAFVSVMPPAETGIAVFTMRLACENPGLLDVFTTFDTTEAYFDTLSVLGDKAELFPIEMLSFIAATRRYKTVIFAVGNSNHNIQVARRLRTIRGLDIAANIVVQVHDPVLFSLSRRILLNRDSIDRAYAQTYPQLKRAFSETPEPALLDLGISGFSALFRESGINRVIVHSDAAAEILIRDFGESPRPPISRLFHPVFPAQQPRRPIRLPPMRGPVIASFGVPGSKSVVKNLISAVCEFRRTSVDPL
jgi:hypothetical protein